MAVSRYRACRQANNPPFLSGFGVRVDAGGRRGQRARRDRRPDHDWARSRDSPACPDDDSTNGLDGARQCVRRRAGSGCLSFRDSETDRVLWQNAESLLLPQTIRQVRVDQDGRYHLQSFPATNTALSPFRLQFQNSGCARSSSRRLFPSELEFGLKLARAACSIFGADKAGSLCQSRSSSAVSRP